MSRKTHLGSLLRQAAAIVVVLAVCLLATFDPHPPAGLRGPTGGPRPTAGSTDRLSFDLIRPTKQQRQESPDVHPEGIVKRFDHYPITSAEPAISSLEPEPDAALAAPGQPVATSKVPDSLDSPRGPPPLPGSYIA